MTPIDFFPHLVDIHKQTGLMAVVRQNTEDGRCHLSILVIGGYLDIYRIWGEDHQTRSVDQGCGLLAVHVGHDLERVFEALGIRTTWRVVEVPIATPRPSFLLEPVLAVDLSILPPWSPLPPGDLD